MSSEMLERIERDADLLGIAELAGYLRQHLGPRVCAYLAGSGNQETPGFWARGQREPRDKATVGRLRCGYEATRLLREAYDDETVRAWFVGANELLSDEAPASVLRHGRAAADWRPILPAAQDFVQDALGPTAPG